MSDGQQPSQAIGMDTLAARLSPAEVDQLASALSDEMLAYFSLAVVRQLRRRLGRAFGRGTITGKNRPSALERAAQQLATELSGSDETEHDW